MPRSTKRSFLDQLRALLVLGVLAVVVLVLGELLIIGLSVGAALVAWPFLGLGGGIVVGVLVYVAAHRLLYYLDLLDSAVDLVRWIKEKFTGKNSGHPDPKGDEH